MIDIKSMSLEQITELTEQLQVPKFRAKQIYGWLCKGVTEFGQMNNLPKTLIELLGENCYIAKAEIQRRLTSQIDGTVKYLFRFNDGEFVESVVMKYHHGYTICISTQVGCKMGCTFCATGKSGFSRSLTASEMIAQIETAQRDLNIRISNIVLMGMGEPLDNFDNVISFLQLVSSEDGLNIGMRHISLSTCGLVDKIYKLAEYRFGLTLSVSLHAPNDKIRSQTMPVNKKYPVDVLLKACRDYAATTGRRISFEYAMIDGVNDSDACANELGSKLRGMLCHVNLIPVNNVEGTGYHKSQTKRLQSFAKVLSKYGITATVRRTLGSDINASCGQLRRSESKLKEV